jgi:hypothetical protein
LKCIYSTFFYYYYSLSMALQPTVGPWPLFSFVILYVAGRTPWTGISPSQGHYLHTDIHTSSGVQPLTPAFQWAKTVPNLGRAPL